MRGQGATYITSHPGTASGVGALYARSMTLGGQPTRRFQVFVPANYVAGTPMPCCISLHGSGTKGDYTLGDNDPVGDGMGPTVVPQSGALNALVKTPASSTWTRSIVIFPQEPNLPDVSNGRWEYLQEVYLALRLCWAEWNIDPKRVYLCGNSRGGNETFELLLFYPHLFAAAVVTPGNLSQDRLVAMGYTVSPFTAVQAATVFRAARPSVPMAATVGTADATYTTTAMRALRDTFIAAGFPLASYTEYAGLSHGSAEWAAAYQDTTLMTWLHSQSR